MDVPKWAYLTRNVVLIAAAGIGLAIVPYSDSVFTYLMAAVMAAPFAVVAMELPHVLHIGSLRTVSR